MHACRPGTALLYETINSVVAEDEAKEVVRPAAFRLAWVDPLDKRHPWDTIFMVVGLNAHC